jgi:hypothetical protein
VGLFRFVFLSFSSIRGNRRSSIQYRNSAMPCFISCGSVVYNVPLSVTPNVQQNMKGSLTSGDDNPKSSCAQRIGCKIYVVATSIHSSRNE